MSDWNTKQWGGTIPQSVIESIFFNFFEENGEPIKTASQYHTETMWDHVQAVFRNFESLWGQYGEKLQDFWTIGSWGVLLHDIAKPATIVDKYRKICPKCHRPNVPVLREKKVKECFGCGSDDLTSTSEKWQVCNDCGKFLVKKLEEKDNTQCYMCKSPLGDEVILQHGWHGHDVLGGSEEFISPYLNKIEGLSDEDKTNIRKLVRCHSIVHAIMHREFKSSRGMAEANKQNSMHRENFEDEFGFNPFSREFSDSLVALFGSREIAIVAVLLSAADDRGKQTEIVEERFSDEFIGSLIQQLLT